MKKILALAVLAVASISASAQNFYAGGSLGYMHDGKESTNSFTILPEVGYNLNSNWAVGTTIGFQYSHLCGAGTSTNLFSFDPYVRYTFFKSSNNLVNIFVDGGFGIGLGWTSYNSNSSATAVTYNVGISPGLAINLSDKFSLVTHIGFLGYEGANNTAKATGVYNDRGGLLLNGNNLTFGFYYNF